MSLSSATMDTVQRIVPQIPRITPAQCEEIIKKKFKNNNNKIADYKLVNLEEKCGFLGEHCQLIITVNIDAHNSENNTNQSEEINCFAKFMPDTQAQIDFVVSTGAFKKEVFMYEELFPKINDLKINYLQSCIPECYFTKQDYVIISEDIAKLGYKPLSKYQFLDYDHVIIVLKSMAKLHASSLIFEEKCSEQLKKPYEITDDFGKYFYETFYVNEESHKGGQGVFAAIKGLQSEVDIFPNDESEVFNKDFKKWLATAGLDLFEVVKPSTKYRNVLCHGDLWNTNVMIKYDNNKPHKCMLLDFQTIRYCPPAHDFMSFIHLATSHEFRKDHLRNLQKIYYNELEQLLYYYGYNLNTVISFKEFTESCKAQRLFAAVLTATYVQLTQIKNEFIVDFVQDNAKWDEAMYKDRSLMVTVNCERDPEYKKKLQETLEELREIFKESIS